MRRRLNPAWKTLGIAAFSACLAFAACPLLPHERLSERVLPMPSRVYGRPQVLKPGLRLSLKSASAGLQRAGYQEVTGELRPGTYRQTKRHLEVERRAFHYPDGPDPGGRVALELDGSGRVRALRDASDQPVAAAFLEPEVIGTLFGDGEEDRIRVTLAELPPHLIEAVLVTEDRRFRWHPGVDPIRILAALRGNYREGRIVEGASTLTQQLVKNLYLGPERTWSRKLREVIGSVWLELRYSKNEILDAYLNQVYLGQNGGRAIHGVGRAASFYFGKAAAELSVAESALLAGLIQAPSALSPFRHPQRAQARRDQVLDLMLARQRIDPASHASARAKALGIRREDRAAPLAPHYVDWVAHRLGERFAQVALERDGFAVFTTLDADFQQIAEAAVAHELRRLEKGYPSLRREDSPLQAALVAMDPASGDVLAYVGGRDYQRSPFDRARRAHRQPGSVFKPVVLLAALTSRQQPRLGLATLLADEPLSLRVEGETWQPTNHDGRHRGPVSVRRAIEDSLNIPIARLGMEVGLVHVADTALRLGITSPLRPIPSLSLGAFEMTPLEVAAAYSVFASGGVLRPPRTTLAVLQPGGRVRRGDPLHEDRVVRSAEAYLVTKALQGAVDRGTGRSLRGLGVGGPIAGKTGTSNGFRDAWFVGYSPDLVVAVWVGFDDGKRVGLTGAKAALPLFARFVRYALGDAGLRDFETPDGVEVAEVDPATGLLASERCPGEPEFFLSGTAPRKSACRGGWRQPFVWVRDALGR